MGGLSNEKCLNLHRPSFNEVGLRVGMRDPYSLLFKLENRAKWDLLSISNSWKLDTPLPPLIYSNAIAIGLPGGPSEV